MLNLTSVVIDKSFLQGCNQSHLRKIIKCHRILVTAELASEIFAAENAILKKCFEDLLTFKDHIDLIDHLGTLFKVELENQTPCSPISTYFLTGELNQNFNFRLDDEKINHIKSFENDIEILGAQKFDKIVLEIKNMSPSLKIEDIRDPEIIRKIYARLKTDKLPPAEKINEQWAIFRRLQVDLIATIEYLQSFKDGKFNIKNISKAHNQIDFRICVFASLTKGIATHDKLIKRYFNYMCPDGYLFTLDTF